MKDDNGLTPLGKIVALTIILIVLGVSVAMIFEGSDIGANIKDFIQNSKSVEDDVQTQDEKNS